MSHHIKPVPYEINACNRPAIFSYTLLLWRRLCLQTFHSSWFYKYTRYSLFFIDIRIFALWWLESWSFSNPYILCDEITWTYMYVYINCMYGTNRKCFMIVNIFSRLSIFTVFHSLYWSTRWMLSVCPTGSTKTTLPMRWRFNQGVHRCILYCKWLV